jgi:DNA polymerase-3 subunit delta'
MNGVIHGHEWAETLLQYQLASGQVRHAYLFTGPDGVGRRTLALRFAQAINCTNPPAPGKACGDCHICINTAKMQQVDLSIVQAENPGAMIKVDQVRALQHSLSLSPYEARYRIALLLDFEAANANAQNALLKTLEEAPDKVILVITASSAEELLPTIVSRCELLRLRPLPVDQLSALLISEHGADEATARQAAALAGGRVGVALRFLTDPREIASHTELVDSLFELLECNLRQRFARVEGMIKAPDQAGSRAKLRETLQAWIGVWRDALLIAGGSAVPITNLAHQDAIQILAKSLPVSRIHARLRLLEEGLTMLDQNVNPRLLLENILLEY